MPLQMQNLVPAPAFAGLNHVPLPAFEGINSSRNLFIHLVIPAEAGIHSCSRNYTYESFEER